MDTSTRQILPSASLDFPQEETFKIRSDSEILHDELVAGIIPAYNEALMIGSIVLQARNFVDEVFVIDDGSVDNTTEIAEEAGAITLRLNHNHGKAYALMQGFKLVKKLGFRFAVMLDGDGQHDPKEIPRILNPVLNGEADLVIGSRYLKYDTETPVHRKFGQKILDFFTNFSSDSRKFKASDSQSGFRALSTKALNNLDFKSEGYSIESDMISHFSSRNLRITEIPINVNYNVPNGHKKNPVSHGLSVLNDILGLIGYRRPLLFFGIIGVLITSLGFIAAFIAFLMYSSNLYGSSFRSIFLVSLISVICLFLGLFLIVSGFILNSMVQIVKIYHDEM